MIEKTQPNFWRYRINRALALGMPARWAVYEVGEKDWHEFQYQTREILHEIVRPNMSVLDVGCGIGSLLDCIPQKCRYTGWDVSPDLIEIANIQNAHRRNAHFYTFDLRELLQTKMVYDKFDVVILRSIRGTVGDNLPEGEWPLIEHELKKMGRQPMVAIENDEFWERENRPMKLKWSRL